MRFPERVFGLGLGLAVWPMAKGSLRAQVPMQSWDTLVFHGNSMVERMLEQGELQGWVQLSDPARGQAIGEPVLETRLPRHCGQRRPLLLSQDSQWSSEQRVQTGLRAGLNLIEITFGQIGARPPAVFLFDLLGQPLIGAWMASDPDGMAKGYVPQSTKILMSTPLVNPRAKHEVVFVAPTKPGRYPYLCTFPGHWRLMRGVLVVE